MEEQKMNQNETNENNSGEPVVTEAVQATAPVAEPAMADNTNDAEANKAMAIVGYVIPILFFIPLVTEAKNSPFAKFHANQQLNLLLFWVVGQIVGTVLLVVLIGALLLPLVMVAGIVFMVMGIINAANGKMKKLPLIGGFELIK